MSTARRGGVASLEPSFGRALVGGLFALVCLAALGAALLGGILLLIARAASLTTF